MADVLLSLKHAVLRGDGTQQEPILQGNYQTTGNAHQPSMHASLSHPGTAGSQTQYMSAGPQASLSYTVHPQVIYCFYHIILI